MQSSEKENWIEAMQVELKSLEETKTWDFSWTPRWQECNPRKMGLQN